MRDILDEVIRRAEQIEPLTDSIDVRTIGRILNDLDLVDTEFLSHVMGQVPTIVEKLTGLKAKPDHAPLFTDGLMYLLMVVVLVAKPTGLFGRSPA